MPAVSRPIFQTWQPTGVQRGGTFTNTNQQEAPPDTMALVGEMYIDGGAWQGRDGGDLMFSGLSGNVTAIDFVKLYKAGVYTSFIVWSQDDGKIMFSKGTGDPPVARFFTAGTAPVIFKTVKNRVFAANGVMVPQTGRYGAGFRKWGVDAQTASLTRDVSALPYYAPIAATLAVVNGAAGVVGTGTTFTASMVGKAIFIFGIKYQIKTFTDATHIDIDPVYAGVNNPAVPAATPTTGSGWFIGTGSMSWENGAGLKYAVSYYDPVVGHTSNLSPLLDVNEVDELANSTSVTVSNIIRTGDVVNFTQIIVWRTAHGGADLFPLALIDNFPAGPTSYTDDNNSDTILGDVVGHFPGPQLTNAPPPQDLNFISYWDGRFWGSSKSNPGLLYYSGKNSADEIIVGVAEECWPVINTLPVEDNDGVITGTRVVGSSLYAMTGRKIYVVTGSNPINYRLLPVSSKGFGSQQTATAELPGEDQNSSDILVHMGNDGHMYFLYGPGGDVSFSYSIQNQFRTPSGPKYASNFNIAIFHSIKSTYVVVGDVSGTKCWFFDIDRKVWFNMQVSSGPFAEGFTDNDGYCFVGGLNNFISKLKLDDTSVGVSQYRLITQLATPTGGERTDPKQLELFSVYGTGFNAGNLNVKVSVDGGAPVLMTNVTSTAVQIFNEPTQFDFTVSQVMVGLVYQFDVGLSDFTAAPPPKVTALRAKYSVSEGPAGAEL